MDHLHPRGTKNDNSINLEFNRRLAKLGPIKLLDLGCSGGGFVESIRVGRGEAIGIEGSDYSQKMQRASWRTIPDYLFTADISKPFSIVSDGALATFNTVTAWEVLEHLSLDQLEALNTNIHAHTLHAARFIVSITTVQDHHEGIDYHETLAPLNWWEQFFTDRGWKSNTALQAYFHPQWVRGPNTEGPVSGCFVFEKR